MTWPHTASQASGACPFRLVKGNKETKVQLEVEKLTVWQVSGRHLSQGSIYYCPFHDGSLQLDDSVIRYIFIICIQFRGEPPLEEPPWKILSVEDNEHMWNMVCGDETDEPLIQTNAWKSLVRLLKRLEMGTIKLTMVRVVLWMESLCATLNTPHKLTPLPVLLFFSTLATQHVPIVGSQDDLPRVSSIQVFGALLASHTA